MSIIEVMEEVAYPLGDNKDVANNPIKVPNQEEGVNKITIGGNTKAAVGNTILPTEAIITTIIMVIIGIEVAVAMVEIIIEAVATGAAVAEAIRITNIISTTHMMMDHRWSNMAHHAPFAVALTTPLNTALRVSMTLIILRRT